MVRLLGLAALALLCLLSLAASGASEFAIPITTDAPTGVSEVTLTDGQQIVLYVPRVDAITWRLELVLASYNGAGSARLEVRDDGAVLASASATTATMAGMALLASQSMDAWLASRTEATIAVPVVASGPGVWTVHTEYAVALVAPRVVITHAFETSGGCN